MSSLQPDDPHLSMAKDLKNQGLSNIKIRKELKELGLDEEYITAIIREINPAYHTSPRLSHEENSGQKKSGWKSVWSIALVVFIIIRILMRLASD